MENFLNGKWKMENGKLRDGFHIFRFPFSVFRFFLIFLCAINLSCHSSAPTDLRAFMPAGTLVYLETNDLSETLSALTENEAFEELAAGKPDFSALANVQFAVAVTGFELSEQQVADEQAILNFKPRFVAVADTHAFFDSSAASIAETQIGKLARQIYGDDVKLEKSERADARFFVWTSGSGGRKIFSAVAGGFIYVGNDESVLDECLEIRRGAAESLLKNERLERARQNANGEDKSGANRIAFGYVSTEGAAQIANLAGVSLAIEATEDDDARGFIARVLPEIFQKSVREISWTATKNNRAIEDKISILMNDETALILNETMQPQAHVQTNSVAFLPSDVFSATAYNLQNPLTAWRGSLFAVGKQTDAGSAKILNEFSGSLLEPYGISDAETFLGAVGSSTLR